MTLRQLRWVTYVGLAFATFGTVISARGLAHHLHWTVHVLDGALLAMNVIAAAGLCWNLARIRRREQRDRWRP